MPRAWNHPASNARTGYKQHPASHTLRLAWRGDNLGQRSFGTWLIENTHKPRGAVCVIIDRLRREMRVNMGRCALQWLRFGFKHEFRVQDHRDNFLLGSSGLLAVGYIALVCRDALDWGHWSWGLWFKYLHIEKVPKGLRRCSSDDV